MLEGGVPSRFLNEMPEKTLDVPVEPLAYSRRVRCLRSAAELALDGGTAALSTEYAQAEAPDDAYSARPSPRSPRGKTTGYAVGNARPCTTASARGSCGAWKASGDQTRVTVIFDAGGERKFLVHYAPMRPL